MSVTATETAPAAPPADDPPGAPVRVRRTIRSRLLGIYATLAYIWLFAPLVVIVAFSFNRPTGKFNTRWNELTFQNWLHPFRKQDYTEALITSLKVAAVACIVATILGGLMALALSRYQFRVASRTSRPGNCSMTVEPAFSVTKVKVMPRATPAISKISFSDFTLFEFIYI